jgi:hypothetical protein
MSSWYGDVRMSQIFLCAYSGSSCWIVEGDCFWELQVYFNPFALPEEAAMYQEHF